jgi:glycosyltransferase involved in cell wall biosynthesis
VETLLKAFQIAGREHGNLRLALAGGILAESFQDDSGTYADGLHELAKELGIADKIRWIGGFEHDSDLPSLCLRATDLCVLPFDEGVKLNNSSFAAAAAHGLPIITTRSRGTKAAPFVDGQNVLLCLPKDPIALAAAICQLVSQPELRARLSRGAIQLTADQFSWEKAISVVISSAQASPNR